MKSFPGSAEQSFKLASYTESARLSFLNLTEGKVLLSRNWSKREVYFSVTKCTMQSAKPKVVTV